MNTRSAKNKGNRLQNHVADLLGEYLGITIGDIKKTTAGVNGPDVEVADAILDHFPFSVECKNVEKVNVWAAYEQAVVNCKGPRIPLAVIKRNRSKCLAIIEITDFLNILAMVRRLKNGEKHEPN